MRLVIGQLRTRSSAGEDGFTLVEILVACLLLALVLVIMFAILLDVFRSSERTRQRSKAQRNVTLMSEKLSSDIHAMRAPNRDPKDTGGLEMMREGFTVSDHNWEIHDIILANPDRLIFFAEIDSVGENSTAVDNECIEWISMPDQSVHRRVYPYSKNCSGAVAQQNAKLDEEVVPKPDAENATDKDFHTIFSYDLTEVPAGGELGTCNEGHVEQVKPLAGQASAANATGGGDPASGNYQQTIAAGLGPQQLDRIVAIDLDLRSLVSVKSSKGEANFTQVLTIPSRQQFEFRYSIGCAE